MDAVTTDSTWHITSDDPAALVVAAKVHLPATNQGDIAARALLQALRANGLLTNFVVVVEADKTLKVEKATPVPMGKYGKYLSVQEGQVLTKDALDLAIARAQPEAAANHEKLTVHVGSDDGTHHAAVTMDGKPLTTDAGQAAVVLTTFGPRYAATDVVTLVGSLPLENGLSGDASLTKGLSGLRSDSRGGSYLGFTTSLSKATEFGSFTGRISHSDFSVGGANLPLNQTGRVNKISLEWSRLYSRNLTQLLRLESTKQTSSLLGLFSDSLTNTAVVGGLQYSKMLPDGGISADISIERGLHQSRSLDSPAPLLGDASPHYTALIVNASRQHVYGDWIFSSEGGFQLSTKSTPASSQFYISGPKRGSAHHTGVYSGANGAYVSLQAAGPLIGSLPALSITGIKPIFGIDGGFVKTIDGPTVSTAAVSAGIEIVSSKNARGALTLAVPIKDSTGSAKPRLGLFFQKSF